MPFDPTLPKTDSEMKSAEMRNQFNGLKELIDAIPAGATPTLAQVLAAGTDANGQPITHLLSLNLGTGGFNACTIAQVGSRLRIESTLPIEFAAENTQRIYIDGDGFHGDGNPLMNLGNPGNDDDADTQGARNAAIAAALAAALTGVTQDVTIAGVTLHFTNGLLTGVS